MRFDTSDIDGMLSRVGQPLPPTAPLDADECEELDEDDLDLLEDDVDDASDYDLEYGEYHDTGEHEPNVIIDPTMYGCAARRARTAKGTTPPPTRCVAATTEVSVSDGVPVSIIDP